MAASFWNKLTASPACNAFNTNEWEFIYHNDYSPELVAHAHLEWLNGRMELIHSRHTSIEWIKCLIYLCLYFHLYLWFFCISFSPDSSKPMTATKVGHCHWRLWHEIFFDQFFSLREHRDPTLIEHVTTGGCERKKSLESFTCHLVLVVK